MRNRDPKEEKSPEKTVGKQNIKGVLVPLVTFSRRSSLEGGPWLASDVTDVLLRFVIKARGPEVGARPAATKYCNKITFCLALHHARVIQTIELSFN